MRARRDRTTGSYTMHAYGSERAWVDHYVIEENIALREGTFLVGGGRPSRDIAVRRNYLFGMEMRIGYGAQNEDCEVTANVLVGGDLRIDRYRSAVLKGNALLGGRLRLDGTPQAGPDATLPAGSIPRSFGAILPNRYDPRRAHVAVVDREKAGAVALAAAPFLKRGDRFRLLAPERPWDKPVFAGTCGGSQVALPSQGECAAYVMVKD